MEVLILNNTKIKSNEAAALITLGNMIGQDVDIAIVGPTFRPSNAFVELVADFAKLINEPIYISRAIDYVLLKIGGSRLVSMPISKFSATYSKLIILDQKAINREVYNDLIVKIYGV